MVLSVCPREFFCFCPILFKLQGLLDIGKKTLSVQTRRSNSIFCPLGARFNFHVFCQKWVSGQKIDFFTFYLRLLKLHSIEATDEIALLFEGEHLKLKIDGVAAIFIFRSTNFRRRPRPRNAQTLPDNCSLAQHSRRRTPTVPVQCASAPQKQGEEDQVGGLEAPT